MSRSSLHDGATPIIVPDDEENIVNEIDDVFNHQMHISLTAVKEA